MPTRESSREKARDERLQAHKKSSDHYVVYNPTSQSAYDIYRSPGGVWFCTCPYAQKSSRVSNSNPCKHLARVLDKEEGCITCGNSRDRLVNQKCAGCYSYERIMK